MMAQTSNASIIFVEKVVAKAIGTGETRMENK